MFDSGLCNLREAWPLHCQTIPGVSFAAGAAELDTIT
jgi:hypothetical protein